MPITQSLVAEYAELGTEFDSATRNRGGPHGLAHLSFVPQH